MLFKLPIFFLKEIKYWNKKIDKGREKVLTESYTVKTRSTTKKYLRRPSTFTGYISKHMKNYL